VIGMCSSDPATEPKTVLSACFDCTKRSYS
jgi:hypothetical protein